MITDPRQIENLKIHFNEALFQRRLVSWYQKNKRSLPWRQRWDQTQDPFVVWVSEIMLQQTVIKAVIPAYERFLGQYPDFRSLAAAEEEDVRLASRGLGYYRRFRMLHQAAQYLVDNPHLEWPTTFTGWKALPGIGDYTAAAISSICFSQAVPVVDGNVERVFCRLLDIRLEPNLPKLKKLFFAFGKDLISKKHPGDYNQGIMELGQTVCTKQKPSCDICPVSKDCLSFSRNSQSLAPRPKQKMNFEDVHLKMFILRSQSKIGLVKRSQSSKFLKETWGFPTAIQSPSELNWDGALPLKIPAESNSESIGSVKHSITKHKISAQIFALKSRVKRDIKWLDIEDVDQNLVSNLDRKAWRLFQKSEMI